ncbi:hypothetical protein T492DRAFT_966875 [Pavlovales sp. CCMP2436]|nr:hypothetical protein T492DRAFT_966875 [Pavlovales sp. CCMP2436]
MAKAKRAPKPERWSVHPAAHCGGLCTAVLLLGCLGLVYLTMPVSESRPAPRSWGSVFNGFDFKPPPAPDLHAAILDLAIKRDQAWEHIHSAIDEWEDEPEPTGEIPMTTVPGLPPSLEELLPPGNPGGNPKAPSAPSNSSGDALESGGDEFGVIGVESLRNTVASWGLDRIDQAKGLDGRAYWPLYDGTGMHIFVISDNGAGDGRALSRGLQWIESTVSANKWEGKSVAVMSLGTPKNNYINRVAARLVSAGVPVVGSDACDYSPASEPGLITVAASDQRVLAELLALAHTHPGRLPSGTPPLLLQTPSGNTIGIQSVGVGPSKHAPPDNWRGSLGGMRGLSASSLIGALALLSCVLTVGTMAYTHQDDDDDDSDDGSDDESESETETARGTVEAGKAPLFVGEKSNV